MIYQDVAYENILKDSFEINKGELCTRLGVKKSYNINEEIIDTCYLRLEQVINYKVAWVKNKVTFPKENVCDFGFVKANSKLLYKNLYGCNEAFIMLATIGIEVDRLLNKLSITSQSEYFITDALSSACVESLCDYLTNRFKENYNCRKRFSPGFGDLSLDIQPYILNRLNANKYMAITLNKANLMIPTKTVTAFMGIENEKDN